MSIIKATAARTRARQAVVPSPHGLISRNEATNFRGHRGRNCKPASVPRVLQHLLIMVEDSPQ